MSRAVKRTISLPLEVAREAEEIAREERKTLNGVAQEAPLTLRFIKPHY